MLLNKGIKVYKDLLGNELADGDKVVTVSKNGRAVGGDLTICYFFYNDRGGASLRTNPDNTGYVRGVYTRLSPSKILKV
jgi:hypothetical protein